MEIEKLAKEWSSLNNLLEPIIKSLDSFPETEDVLEIGFGAFPQMLFFVSHGWNGLALNIKQEDCDVLESDAKYLEINDRIEIEPENIIYYKIEKDKYGVVVISQVLHLINPAHITLIFNKIKSSLIKGGLVFISVPTEEHYAIEHFKKNKKIINERTFLNEKNG